MHSRSEIARSMLTLHLFLLLMSHRSVTKAEHAKRYGRHSMKNEDPHLWYRVRPTLSLLVREFVPSSCATTPSHLWIHVPSYAASLTPLSRPSQSGTRSLRPQAADLLSQLTPYRFNRLRLLADLEPHVLDQQFSSVQWNHQSVVGQRRRDDSGATVQHERLSNEYRESVINRDGGYVKASKRLR